MKLSEIIDLLAVSTAPVAGWTAICQRLGKPWANSGFIALGAVSAGLWVIKTLIRIKRKNARSDTPKHSSTKCKKNNSKHIISDSEIKIKR